MFGSEILELAIGMVFVYTLLSLICSALTELISSWFAMRSRNLEEGIRNLLNNPEYAKQLYEHPLIKRLARQDSKPSYIPSRNFALALLDIIAPADPIAGPRAFKDIRDAATKLSDSEMKKALLVLIDEAEGNLKKVRENIENWFNDAMDRVSGWYKRWAQQITLLLAFGIAVVLNADTVMIANSLLRDDALRASVIAVAERTVKESPLTEKEPIEEIQAELQQLQLPIGWSSRNNTKNGEDNNRVIDPRALPCGLQEWYMKIIGLLITTIAISLGAPFWFDILNKLVNLRSVGKKPQPEKTAKETPEQ